MRNFTLLFILAMGAICTYAQPHLERQEVTALNVQYQSQSFHHLSDYQLSAPVLQIRQDVHWRDILIQVGSNHLPGEFNILRGARFGIRYRPVNPYKERWWEAGLGFSYDKQDPSLSQSGKLTGWTATLAAYRPVNEWYAHTGRASAGLYQGYAIDPERAVYLEYLPDDLTHHDLDHVRIDLQYTGRIMFVPFDLEFEVGHRRSRYSWETPLRLQIVKSLSLSAGQRLDLWAGLTAIGFRRQMSVLPDDKYTEILPPGLRQWTVKDTEISPVVWQAGVRMSFLRGKKQRAF